MSSYRVNAQVTKTLQDIVWTAFREDTEFNIVTINSNFLL